MKAIWRFMLALVLLFLQGCFMTYVAVTNKTGQPITVTSGHTHESYRVAPEQTKDIPHSAGDLMIETKSGKKWTEPNVTALDSQNQSHFIFWQKRVKAITVEEPK